MTKEQEDLLLKEGKMLPVMEHFYTIQGEGFHAGKAAYFIRLGGCDVGCHWCDVKESWDPTLHPLMDAETIAETAAKYCKTIVLTVGEPLMWNLEILTSKLKELGCYSYRNVWRLSNERSSTGLPCLQRKQDCLWKTFIRKPAS